MPDTRPKPGGSIVLTEHDIILAQAAQKELLADSLKAIASLSDAAIDALGIEDVRHTLKVATALAKNALTKTRMAERPSALTDLHKLAIACGNEPFADEMVCLKCEGRGHVPRARKTEASHA